MFSTKRTISIICAAALMLLAGTALAAKPTIVGIAAEPYPPFTYLSPDGKWTGFEIDLSRAVCKEAGLDCTWRATAWSGIIPALNGGKIDMIFNSMSITAPREKVVNFTRPYYVTTGAYVAPVDMQIKIPERLKGKTLGVQLSTTHARYARKVLVPKYGVHLKFYNKQVQDNRDLEAHRVDVILADQVAMSVFVKDHPKFAIKGTVPLPNKIYGPGIGVAVRKSDTQLLAKLNKAINAVLKDGTCAKLSDKYFGSNICASPSAG